MRKDEIAVLGVRTTIETDDGALIYVGYLVPPTAAKMVMKDHCKVDRRLVVRRCRFRRACTLHTPTTFGSIACIAWG